MCQQSSLLERHSIGALDWAVLEIVHICERHLDRSLGLKDLCVQLNILHRNQMLRAHFRLSVEDEIAFDKNVASLGQMI